MRMTLENLKDRYETLLQSYLVVKGETALQKAYEMGREALTAGASLLDLVTLHHEVVVKFLAHSESAVKSARVAEMSGNFLREALSSFEMIQRGYKDTLVILRQRADDLNAANRKLRELNETLEQKVSERTATLQEKALELSRSNAELQQFVHVASHDLKEPIRMITSYVQMLQRMDEEKPEEKSKEYMNYVVEGTHRIRDLLDDLLAYTRLGAFPLSTQKVDLSKVFRETLSVLSLVIEENRAEISCDALPVVEADPAHMGLLFQNLLSNAMKFHGQALPRVRVSHRREKGHWLFQVADNGIGIEPRYFEKIFVVFQRLHSRDQYPGTGIGLALCKKIVEQHGGEIWVESQEGKGTTFSFTIPIKE